MRNPPTLTVVTKTAICLALLLIDGRTSLPASTDGEAWRPVDRPHPWLFLSGSEIDRAREKIDAGGRARETFDRMIRQAEKDLNVELPEFETTWWAEARTKPWRDTYPEIARHTTFVPSPAMRAAQRLAQVSRLADDGERFARRAGEILLHYTAYSFEFEHYDVGMNYAIWGVPALDVYDLLYDRFNAEEHRRIDAFFRRFHEAVMKNDRYWVENEPGGRFNNHYAFHKQAIAAIGLFYGRDDLVDYAIESPEGVRDLMENGIRDDGLWLEGSFHYHFTPLYGLVPLAEMFRHAGGPIDLYRMEFAGGHSLKQLFVAPFEVAFPDGMTPNIGDGYGRDLHLQNVYLYEYAHAAYADPRFAWLLSRESPTMSDEQRLYRDRTALLWGRPLGERQAPDVRSRVFPEHGYVMLRSVEGADYWRGEGCAVLLTFDRAGIHSHLDKLGLILWGRGRLFAQDVEGRPTEGHAFSSPIQRELNRRTICSNTVVVDGRDQKSVGELLDLRHFGVSDRSCSATIADLSGRLYPGVRLQRTVIVRPDLVLDVFRLESKDEHQYDWTFHPLDEAGRTRAALPFEPLPPGESPSPKWIKGGRHARSDSTWSAEWSARGIRFRLTMIGAPGTEIRVWNFPRDDRFTSPPIPMLQVRRHGRTADFVAVYESGKTLPDASDVRSKQEPDGSLTVTFGTQEAGHVSAFPVARKRPQ